MSSIIIALAISIAGGGWWLFLEGTPPSTPIEGFEIERYRQLVDAGSLNLPIEMRFETVGTDVAPGFAGEAGNFFGEYHASYTATQVVWPDKHIIIDAAVDYEGSQRIKQSDEHFAYYPESFQRIMKGISSAESTWITHAHLDHVMGIALHPNLVKLSTKINLNRAQKDLWDKSSARGMWPEMPDTVKVIDISEPKLIAPGVVVIPTVGHTPGSQSFYIQLKDKREYLMIGDVVWLMSNVENLKTRPRILELMFFEEKEDRKAVLSQIRALNDLAKQEPNLMIIPSHDTKHLQSLFDSSDVIQGFLLKE